MLSHFKILPEVRYNNNLTNTEKMMYVEVVIQEQNNGYCGMTNDELARLYNQSVKTVSRSLCKLREMGYLKSKNYKGKRYLTSTIDSDTEYLQQKIFKKKFGE